MATCVVELNDQQVRVTKDGEILVRSRGCAILKGSEIEIGEAACRKAHLHPREFHNRFWYQLNQAGLRKPTPNARHHADLAFNHLEHIHKAAGSPKSMLFAVPGGFSKEQLALLLGIAAACKITISELVDSAVASAASCVAPGAYRHIEMQLHRTVITDLSIGDYVSRTNVEILDGVGFHALEQRLVAFIADQFLAQSRFDPLHQANTEQLLFNELPNWLELLDRQREIVVHIDYRRSRFEARLSREGIVEVVQPFYLEIQDRLLRDDRCLIGERLGTMPGFADSQKNQIVLPEDAVFNGCATLVEKSHTENNGVSLITKVPATGSPSVGNFPTTTNRRTSSVATLPTHLLCGATAYALTDHPLSLSKNGDIKNSTGQSTVATISREDNTIAVQSSSGALLFVNRSPIEKISTLRVGDVITIEGTSVVYNLIRVVTLNAP